MKINNRWAAWKIGTVAAVATLVLADAILCFALWQLGREAPAEMAENRNHLASTEKQLEADIARGQRIRAELPEVGKSSDDFYRDAFLDSRTVYSTVDSDIAAIAEKSGVKTTGLQFKPKDVPNYKVGELDINMAVIGDYPSLLKFINGIERSKNFYFLNQLQLAESGPNGIRLQLELHTYYRT